MDDRLRSADDIEKVRAAADAWRDAQAGEGVRSRAAAASKTKEGRRDAAMRQAKIKRFNALDYTGTEAINTICTNLSFSGRDRKRIADSPAYMPGAGKSYMCLNILHNMAKRGKRVLMIDADLRRSSARFLN